MAKKWICALLCVCFISTLAGAFDMEKQLNGPLEKTGAWLAASEGGETLSPGNEWAVIGLARWGQPLPASLFAGYYESMVSLLHQKSGVLHANKYTEYARAVLALTAIGRDATDVGGWNVVAPLDSFDSVVRQGVNGAAYALLALDAAGSPDQELRQRYLDYILDAQLADGGFALTGTAADPDVTAMALQALAPQRNEPGVEGAVQRALDRLSLLQKDNGGYETLGVQNAESCAQVIIALCTLGVNPQSEAYVKNGVSVVDAMMAYAYEDGFLHIAEGSRVNETATVQCFLALVAMQRLQNGKVTVFDMSDAVRVTAGVRESFGLPQKHADITQVPVLYQSKTFSDITGHPNRQAIEALARRGILNGRDDAVFAPNESLTRSEFTALIIRALGLPARGDAAFLDVPANAWYAGYVAAAVKYGIVTGRTADTFDPSGVITRQEAAVMVTRAAGLCGMDNAPGADAAQDILAGFSDSPACAVWAAQSLAFCYNNGILPRQDEAIRPLDQATRGEIAQMVAAMLEAAQLLTNQ